MLAGRSFIFLAAATATLSATPALAQRAAPENITVTAMKDGAVVSWRGLRDRSVSYRVLRGTDPRRPGQDLTKPLPADATSYNDPQVTPGTTVFYTVVAVYPDGSEGASPPAQFTPAPSAPMPSAQVSSRLTSGMSPKLGPAPVLRATPVNSVWKDFWVTLTWAPVQTVAPEPVSYVLRRSPYDPATVPPSYQPGFVSGTPALKNGAMTLIDRNGDRENPVWYMVVATSTSQGGVNFPWYRQDPPPHRGVDTIIGHYWHTGMGPTSNWVGCVRGSLATDAMAYVARVRAGSVGWITIQTAPLVNGKLAGPGMNIGYFDTGRYHTLEPPLNGGYVPQIQMWPIVGAYGTQQAGIVTIPDTMHLVPLVYSVTQSTTALNTSTCTP